MMKVLVTSNLPEDILLKMEENFELDYHDSNIPLKKEEIIERIEDVDALLCPLSDRIDEDIIKAGKNLKIIANYGAGFDNIDIKIAREHGIDVSNAPAPSSAVSTAELAFSLIMAASRRLFEGEKDLRKGNFLGWRPTYFLGSQLKGKTLGIIGMGNIGQELAKRALAFEMKVIYHSRTRKPEIEKLGAIYTNKDDLLKEADFISLHTAFSEELKHMISTREFDMMKDSAYLINAARGPLVEEKELVKALRDGLIKGAALDVYEFEPKVSDELLELDNIILIPHLGNATVEARLEMGQAAFENLIDKKNGNTPRNLVN